MSKKKRENHRKPKRKKKRNKGMKENIRRSPADFKQGLEFV
jgi:hypothetical protein